MAKSERAKALAEAQKAQRRAIKEAKKNSTDPKDWGRMRQFREAYRITHEYDKQLPYWMIGAFVFPIVIALIVLAITQPATLLWVMWLLFAITSGAMIAMLLLTRRMKASTLRRFEGQAGSAEVALSMLPKEWTHTPVITATRQQDIIHRAIGPGGLILIGEGDQGRLKQLMASETRKHEQVAYGVTVQQIFMGDKPGQVPLNKLTETLRKLPKQLDATQVTQVSSRLRALDAVRPRVPMPKGPMNVKGARQAMRGR